QLSHLPTWIPESRLFSTSVMDDILQHLYSDTDNLTRKDRKSLVRLESLWSRKFNAEAHRPEPNPRPLTPPPAQKPRKWAPRKRNNPAVVKFNYVDIDTLPDHQVVPHKLGIPRLRPHWKLTKFMINLPAYIFKRQILEKNITWEMLDKLMAMDPASGTVFFQKFADEVVKKNPL
ncbi:hypothetical protein KR200_005466, partial [Drosophila serrata]